MNDCITNNGIILPEICNSTTVNIFTDGSAMNGKAVASYGLIAVVENEVIYIDTKLTSHATINNAELKGIRAALTLAYNYKDTFSNINIFSDSKLSIQSLKEFIYNWRMNKWGTLYTKGKPVVSQGVIVESRRMLDELELAPSTIRIFHISSHIGNTYNELVEASYKFKVYNNIPGIIDLNAIRYITSWNNHVDYIVKNFMRKNKSNKNQYIDPIRFLPIGAICNMEYDNIL